MCCYLTNLIVCLSSSPPQSSSPQSVSGVRMTVIGTYSWWRSLSPSLNRGTTSSTAWIRTGKGAWKTHRWIPRAVDSDKFHKADMMLLLIPTNGLSFSGKKKKMLFFPWSRRKVRGKYFPRVFILLLSFLFSHVCSHSLSFLFPQYYTSDSLISQNLIMVSLFLPPQI